MLNLENILSQFEIDRLHKTHNLKSISKLVDWIAQTLNSFPWTYEWAVRSMATEDLDKNIENPLKTILIISWLCHATNQGKLSFNGKPIRLKMDDYLVHHIWSFSLPSQHYSMCIESLYLFYQSTNGFSANFLSLDQLRVYPALKSDKPILKGKQRSYLKVKEQICQVVEQAFLQHNLYMPIPPNVYNPLSKKDVNNWLSLVLNANCVDTLQVSNEILDHLAHVQAVCQKYGKQSNTAKDVQPVWISF